MKTSIFFVKYYYNLKQLFSMWIYCKNCLQHW